MGYEVSWLGNTGAPLATSARRRPFSRRFSSKSISASSVDGAPGSAAPVDRRWYNPDRRKREFYSPPKPVRRWVQAEHTTLHDCPSKDSFVLLSYNILGEYNASKHHELYWNIPSDFMNWNSRKRLICHEIRRWNADLLCLQEVDRYEDISICIRRKGYVGGYKGRTGGAKDGCALFWKKERFKLLEVDNIEFRSFGLHNNVAQLFVLELSEDDQRRVVVGNIHVLFNPKRGDVKFGQVHRLLLKANALSEKWGGIPVVLAGDFNSTPESAIYEFLSTSKLNIALHGRKKVFRQDKCQFVLDDLPCLINDWTGENLTRAIVNSHDSLITHPLQLKSSYASVQRNASTRNSQGEPLATSCHSKFLGTVDYIWYSTGLACTRVLDTLPLDTLRKLGGLPCKDIGSDHLALVAEFKFTGGNELQQDGN
ncbi:unnamed protein product [Musa acuminata subsp. burmannicoides]